MVKFIIFKKMKNRPYFLIVLISVFTLLSCSSNRNITQSDAGEPKIVDRGYDQVLEKDATKKTGTVKPNENAPSNRTLADMIRSLPGVTVTGSDDNPRIIVGGMGSFSNNEPLFVINGSAVGLNFAQIAASINPNEITSVSVLKGSDAAIYGTRGANGVILIRTK
jgi:TonB-dependent SusC/RagA subfamily outer membrane receptor